jgi:hypothetical protein
MADNNNEKSKTEKKKGFFARMFEKMDSKMEAKAESKPCCCQSDDKNKSCCS